MPKPKQSKSSNRKKKPVVPQQGFFSQFVGAVLIIIALVGITSLFVEGNDAAKQENVAISVIANDIAAGSVTALSVEGDKVIAGYAEGLEKVARKEEGSSLQEVMSAYGVTPEALRAVPTTVKDQSGMQILLFTVLPLLLPLVIIVALIWFFSRQMRGAGMQALTFVQSKARMVDPNDKKTRVMFKDVAGAKEAKQELLEIVDFLKNPKKFLDIGAKIPKGVLLMGAPGTGKTLLARAVAGEAGVPFFSISGSEFVEMFVGVGASRVRDLFKVAKAASPSIVFIDEIDAVGRVRGSGSGGSNDEREQTLNQILVEMDGFDPTEKVIVMAATNRPDVLDPALLRPGRFDRRVVVDLPDREDREAILNVHALEKPLAEDVVLGVIAERTPGFSGADLASLMNEAAILAAREDRKKVAQYDLIRSIEKVMLGPERQSHLLNAKEKEITAYHEAGHALIASVLPYADPVHKISVISRGRAAGYTLKLPIEDKKMQSKKEFLDDIAVSLGGYTAERLIFGDITTGPSNDIQVLTALARDMVTRYGMSDVIGPIALEGNEGRALFGRGVYGDEHSQKVSEDIDREVKKIITDAEEKAVNILNDHRSLLDAIAKRLMEVETIERDDFEVMLIAHGIQPKKKQDIEHTV